MGDTPILRTNVPPLMGGKQCYTLWSSIQFRVLVHFRRWSCCELCICIHLIRWGHNGAVSAVGWRAGGGLLLCGVGHTSLLWLDAEVTHTLIVCFKQTHASPIVPLDFAADL